MTVAEAARQLGLGASTVRVWARATGVQRHGRGYWLTDRDVRRLAALIARPHAPIGTKP